MIPALTMAVPASSMPNMQTESLFTLIPWQPNRPLDEMHTTIFVSDGRALSMDLMRSVKGSTFFSVSVMRGYTSAAYHSLGYFLLDWCVLTMTHAAHSTVRTIYNMSCLNGLGAQKPVELGLG